MKIDTDLAIFLGVIALALTTGGIVIMSGTRGIRNNNPGNIRKTSTPWQGLAPVQDDPEFFKFIAPEWGIRAMARILYTYRGRGLDTIREIVTTWAPPHENNTAAYIENVAAWTGIPADRPVNYATELTGLIAALIRQENGRQPYDAETIQKGIALA